MKKVFAALLVAALSVCLCAALPACGNEHVHEYTSAVTKAATCSEKGVKTYKCECGEEYTEDIPKLAHTVVEDAAVAATCTAEGKTAGSHCSVCGTVVNAQETVAKLEHILVEDAAVAATCTAEGKTAGSHCSVCGTVVTEQEKIAMIEHTVVEDAAVAATCTTSGKTAGSHCSVCGKVIVQQRPVTAAHTVVDDPAVPATCFTDGKTAGSHCSVCGIVIVRQETVKAAHNFTVGVCSVCGDVEATTDGVVFEKIESGAAYRVTGYEGVAPTVMIASVHEGKPVVAVADSAFANNGAVTKVCLGREIQQIGSNAFGGCAALAEISVTDRLSKIGDNAFDGTAWYENEENWDNGVLYLTAAGGNSHYLLAVAEDTQPQTYALHSLRAAPRAAKAATRLGHYKVKPGTKYIAPRAFTGRTTLTGITIPDSLVSIGEQTFESCENLETVDFGNGVRVVGSGAFGYCNALKSIHIPASVMSLGEDDEAVALTFYDCHGLEGITVDEANAVYEAKGNCLIAKATKTLVKGCRNSVIPADGSVTSIGCSAFERQSSLTELDIPASVEFVDSRGNFSSCTALSEINVHPNADVSECGFTDTAWYNDENNWTDGVLYLTATDGETKTLVAVDPSTRGKFTVASGTKTICGGAFDGCAELTEVVFPDSVTKIGNSIFRGCTNLTKISLPDTVTSIGDLDGLDLDYEVDEYGVSYLSSASGATKYLIKAPADLAGSYTVDSKTKAISRLAFAGCTELTSAVLPTGLKEIPRGAFSGCAKFASVVIPNTVTKINAKAFHDCALTSLDIPEGVKSIDVLGCAENKTLKTLSLPSTLTLIGRQGLYGLISLESLTVTAGNPVYESKNNCLIEKSTKTLIVGCKNSTIPDDGSVFSIGMQAFDMVGLRSVVIPASVRYIGSGAFSNNPDLVEIYNLSDLTFILGEESNSSGSDISRYAKVIHKSLDEPSCFVKNGNFEFFANEAGNEYLLMSYDGTATELTLPADYDGHAYVVHNLGSNGTVKKLTVPAGATLSADCLRGFTAIEEVVLSEGITGIGERAFAGIGTLKKVSLPGSVVSIESRAFSGCEKLEELNVGNNIEFIGEGAFDGTPIGEKYDNDGAIYLQSVDGTTSYLIGSNSRMSIVGDYTIKEGTRTIAAAALQSNNSLTGVSIPASVKNIAAGAFQSCNNLRTIIVDTDNTVYKVVGNCLISVVDKKLIWGNVNSVIPKDGSVTVIASYAFDVPYFQSIALMEIPDAITELEEHAFRCSIDNLILPKNIKLGSGAYGWGEVENVYYGGTQADWNKVVSSDRWDIRQNNLYFYSANAPETAGSYWHYVGGVPTVWE